MLLQRTDALGFSGVAMLVVGVVLYLAASAERMGWLYWLGGPLLWFAGFAMLVGWVIARYSGSEKHESAIPPKLKIK